MNSTESIVLAAVSDNVPVARRYVRFWLSSLGEYTEVLDDLELVASELVTNAIRHGDDDNVEVRLDCDSSMLFLGVTSHGNVEQLAPSGAWEVASANAVAGRGLGIVKSLVDSVEIRRDGATVTILVAKPRTGRGTTRVREHS